MHGRKGRTMKYFITEVSRNYMAPIPTDWFGMIDRKTLSLKKFHQMPRHLLFSIEKRMNTVFTDILTFPCFMVSEMVRDIINRYDASIRFLRIILYDKENKKSFAYYIPDLNRIRFEEKRDAEVPGIRHILVEQEEIKEKAIVEISNGTSFHVIMRMDLVESILRREAIGIGLRKIQQKKGEEKACPI